MSRMQRDKGANWEREVCRRFSAIGMPAKRRLTEVREGNEGDVMLAECFSIQCKVGASPSPYRALREAIDAASPGDYPVAIIRRNQRNGTKKLDMACLPLSDFLELVGKLKAGGWL